MNIISIKIKVQQEGRKATEQLFHYSNDLTNKGINFTDNRLTIVVH